MLSYPLQPLELPAALTAAEREVLVALMAGEPNTEVARLRGTSRRTVANQVASIFRKVGVSSRAELLARLRGRGGE